jgi:sulfhydrogenase subunit beta (sulfur reductase)
MSTPTPPRVLPAARLDELLAALRAGGRLLVGPTARDGAVVLDPIETSRDLARGWKDDHAPGRYRLHREGNAWFGAILSPDSLKRWLYPSRVRLWRAEPDGDGFRVQQADRRPPPLAVIGVRACDLAAVAIQDRVLRDGAHADPHYAMRRADLLVVAVQCADAASTCFCSSMGAGPRVSSGHDLCLTEVLEPEHHFAIEVGSEAGARVLARLDTEPAADPSAPERAAAAAEAAIARHLPTEGLGQRLMQAVEGPHWDKVAERCLGCASCTMVCPTCFCSQVTDLTDLTGAAERVRTWDSCFTMGHSYVHGGSVRSELASRYRQWLTHKLSTWHDQFGTAGCVGCGRCVTWCPAGIDIVQEALAATAETP